MEFPHNSEGIPSVLAKVDPREEEFEFRDCQLSVPCIFLRVLLSPQSLLFWQGAIVPSCPLGRPVSVPRLCSWLQEETGGFWVGAGLGFLWSELRKALLRTSFEGKLWRECVTSCWSREGIVDGRYELIAGETGLLPESMA